MRIPFSAAIQLSADGVTWGAAGAPLQVSASATFYARLASTANVDSTSWTVLSTDDLGSAPALTTSGLADSHVTGTAGAAGTAFIIQATINGGVDKNSGNVNPLTTAATAIVEVPAANGLAVICYDEHYEHGSQGYVPKMNAAIRGAGNGGGTLAYNTLTLGAQSPPQYLLTVGETTTITDGAAHYLLGSTISVASGVDVTIVSIFKGKIANSALPVMTTQEYIMDATTFGGSTVGLWGGVVGAPFPDSGPWTKATSLSTSISGAANASGQIKITVGSTMGCIAGQTTVRISGATTAGGMVLNGSWIVDDVPDSTHLTLRGSDGATGSWTSGGTVVVQLAVGGIVINTGNVMVEGTGLVPANRVASEAVFAGDFRVNGTRIYLYTGAGTLDAGGGPSGTSPGTDGTAPYVHYGLASAGVSVAWTAAKVEVISA